MVKVIRRPFRFDPINRDILRALSTTQVKVTPSQVAKSIGIHPATAQRRISVLQQKNLVNCNLKGNRTYCKANINLIRKELSKKKSGGFF